MPVANGNVLRAVFLVGLLLKQFTFPEGFIVCLNLLFMRFMEKLHQQMEKKYFNFYVVLYFGVFSRLGPGSKRRVRKIISSLYLPLEK